MSNNYNVFNSGSYDNKVYNYIKDAMATGIKRDKTIVNNIANVNTAGYKRFDVVLKNKINNMKKVELKRTETKHLSTMADNKPYEVSKDSTTSMRNDGNNVDIDYEMSNLASNAILYQSLVTTINNEFAMKTSVIKGGR